MLPAIRRVLAPISEHTQHDSRKESEGDDGGKHVEPHPQFHLGFLCRIEPTLQRRVHGANLTSLRLLRPSAKTNRVLQCINIAVQLVVPQEPHRRC